MVTNFIRKKINAAPPDTLFFNRDFINYGSRGAVDMCLIRMESQGFIRRLCWGIYVRFDCTRQYTTIELAEAKAKRFDRALNVHPLNTARELSFTDLKTKEERFHTQGRTTSFRAPQERVLFHATSPRRVALQKIKTGAHINALWWLKKGVATEQHVYDVLSTFKRSEKEEFLWSHDLMPGWLSDLVHKACGGKLLFPLKNGRAA